MKSNLKYFDFDSDLPSHCGEVLDIKFSNAGLGWQGVVLEKGSSPRFYPNNVHTPYFHFAVALDEELHWSAETRGNMTELKTSPGDIWINPPRTPFSHDISEPCHFVILAVEEDVFLESCSLNLLNKRLEPARVRLLSDRGPIAAIGLDLGFNDQSHFTRVFKKQFGLTPGQYQKPASSD